MPNELERDLLAGALAVELKFLSIDQLLHGMRSWDRIGPFSEHLLKHGLSDEDRELLESLVENRLRRCGNHSHALQTVSIAPELLRAWESLSRAAPIADSTLVPSDSTLINPALVPVERSIGVPTSSGGRFQVLQEHARGGLGVVSLAIDNELNREVALKEIKIKYATDEASRARFVLEAKVTGGLEHPAIVPVYGFGRHPDGRPFYAMRFIRGESLSDAVRQYHRANFENETTRRLAFRGLLNRFIAVCQAVHYAHLRGVLHRDLKPTNIMLGDFGETFVVDWGLARTRGAPPDSKLAPLVVDESVDQVQTVAGQAMGTPVYMSPEQASGNMEALGPRSDIYSLGGTLYTILTGELPVQGQGVREVLEKVVAGELSLNDEKGTGTKALMAICKKAMARDPQDRYESAGELAAEIERFLAEEPVRAYPEPWHLRARRWFRKRPMLTASASASTMLLLLFFGIGFLVVNDFNGRLATANTDLNIANGELATSNKNLETANGKLSVAIETATTERKRAETNFEIASEAVDDYLSKVTDNDKLDEADFTELKNELLTTAVPFFEKLLKEKPGDSNVEFYRGMAYRRLGSLKYSTGEVKEAVQNLDNSIEIWDRLLKEDPKESRLLYQKANALREWALYQGKIGTLEKSLSRTQEALRIAESLAQNQDAAVQEDLPKLILMIKASIAGLYNNMGKVADATQSHKETIQYGELLLERNPEDLQSLETLSIARMNLANNLYRQGEYQESFEEYRKAIRDQELLSEKIPKDPYIREGLARSCANFGSLLMEFADPEGAVLFRRAIDLRGNLVKDFPSVERYAVEHADSKCSLGVYLHRFGELSESEKLFNEGEKGLTLLAEKYPDVHEYRERLGLALMNYSNNFINQNQHEQAIEKLLRAKSIFENLVSKFPEDLDTHRNLAAALSNLATANTNLQRLDQARGFNQAAIDKLQELVENYPKIPELKKFLGTTLTNQGIVLMRLKEIDLAGESYQLSLKVLEGLDQEFPGKADIQIELASSLSVNAGYQAHTGNRAESELLYDRAFKLVRRLHENSPESTEFRGEYYQVLFDWVKSALARGEVVHADEIFSTYHLHFTQFLEGNPPAKEQLILEFAKNCRDFSSFELSMGRKIHWMDVEIELLETYQQSNLNQQIRSELLNAHITRAEYYYLLQLFSNALDNIKQALKFDDQGVQTSYLKTQQALNLAHLGKLDESNQIRAELDKIESENFNYLYDSARVEAIGIEHVAGAEEKAQKTMRVLELLRKVQSLGGFKDPTLVNNLLEAGEFNSVRDNAEFIELQNNAEGK